MVMVRILKYHRHSIIGEKQPSPFHRLEKLTIVPVKWGWGGVGGSCLSVQWVSFQLQGFPIKIHWNLRKTLFLTMTRKLFAGGVEIGTTALMERQPGYFSSCVVVPTIFSHFSCSLLQLKPILLQIPHLQLTVFNLYPNIYQK